MEDVEVTSDPKFVIPGFEKGDRVKLGLPEAPYMLVEEIINETEVVCIWFDSIGNQHRAYFEAEFLENYSRTRI